jgi:hypothetical protein
MIESIRKAIALPQVPVQAIVTGLTVSAFAWLLAQGAIQPLAIYLFQLYLSF